jgi:hypothetical protein
MTNTIKVRLTTGASGTDWGFLVDQKDIRTGMTCPLTNPDALAESCHTYANDYDYTWTITDPNATQMRIHFQKISLSTGDTIRLYDTTDKLLVTYYRGDGGENIWTEWYMTNTIKVRLTTGASGTDWGFLVDQKDPPDPVPPDSVTNIHNTTYQQNLITWAWTDPTSANFDHVMIYLNGVFQENVPSGVQTFTATGLSPATAYTVGTRTVGTTGLVNQTWVNHTATTASVPPVPPTSITNLHNTTYQQTLITWAWTDPTSADFDHIMVYRDGVFQANVTAGTQSFTATGLSPATAYTVGTRTVGTTGLVNQTWVNHTATTRHHPQTSMFINLYPGWNFVSTPRTLADGSNTIGTVFEGVDTGGRSIFLYDASIKRWITVSRSDEFTPLDGIWIYSTIHKQVNLTFRIGAITPPPTKPLYPGWNAIGFAGEEPRTAQATLISVDDPGIKKWAQVVGWNAQSGLYNTPIANVESEYGNMMNPTSGYWVFMNGINPPWILV